MIIMLHVHVAAAGAFATPSPVAGLRELHALGVPLSTRLVTMTALGDLVLANGALAGAVLAGGVSERLASYLTAESALERFYERGRNSRFIANCPIWLLTEATAPLIGAGAIHLKDRSE